MKVKTVDIHSLTPNARNVRLHGEIQLRELQRSFEMFGQFRAVVVDENLTILAGHGIWEAMKLAGATECYVYQFEGLSEAKKLKLMLADNQTQYLSSTNIELFDEVIREIAQSEDVDIPGYDKDVLDMIIAEDLAEADEAISSYGQIPEEAVKEIQAAAERREDSYDKLVERAASEIHINPKNIQVDRSGGEHERARPYTVCKNCGEKVWL